MFKTLTSQKIKEVCRSLIGAGKHVILLSGDWKGPYAVAVVVIDDIKASAEVHKTSADVWQVIDGNATFILGGSLLMPTEKISGELIEETIIADTITGGEPIKIFPGDVIDVPPGVPHQIDARGGRVELLINKINGVNVVL